MMKENVIETVAQSLMEHDDESHQEHKIVEPFSTEKFDTTDTPPKKKSGWGVISTMAPFVVTFMGATYIWMKYKKHFKK